MMGRKPRWERAQLSGTPAGRISRTQITMGTLDGGKWEANDIGRTGLGFRKTTLVAE